MRPPGTRLRALAARLLAASTMDYLSDGQMVRVIALYGCVVAAISVLATLGPVRRALRIQPLDALRAD
jgi:ABC-type lipoprotein release transport system permease subunit